MDEFSQVHFELIKFCERKKNKKNEKVNIMRQFHDITDYVHANDDTNANIDDIECT